MMLADTQVAGQCVGTKQWARQAETLTRPFVLSIALSTLVDAAYGFAPTVLPVTPCKNAIPFGSP
jgi:hypothetical protein